MNTTLGAVGVGGLLLGGIGGFVIGGNSGDSSDSVGGNLAAAKTDRAKVVAVATGAAGGSSAVRSLADIYREPSQTARVQMLLDYYSNLDASEFEDAANQLNDLPFSERILASYLLFSEWGEIDPMAALAQTNKMGRGGFFAKPAVLQSWASADPKAAAEYLAENPRDFAGMGRGPGGAASSTIATEWARQDPVAALAWAQGLEGREGSAAIASVLKEVAGDDPAAAVLMAQGLSGDEQSEAYRSIAYEWGKEDWSAMESWANGLPASERDAALAEAIRGVAQTDPELAGSRVLALAEGEARDSAIESVAESWARTDPQAAMEFLMANGSDSAQEEAMRDTMSSLARTDPEAGMALISTMEDGDVRDRAVSSYVFSADTENPADSINLAATIADDRTRERTVSMATGQWLREDAEAATAFLESTDLMDAETIQQIQERATNGGGARRGGGGGGGRGR